MNKSCFLVPLIAAGVLFSTSLRAGNITSVVETGGDGAPTAHFTGETFSGALGNGSTYTVPVFGILAKTYTDRLHAYTNYAGPNLIPSYLLGNEYIMVRNDNRDNASFKIDVTISQDSVVYLLIDNRLGDASNANPPFNPTAITAWPSMTWAGAAGFRPVQSGANRSSNSTLPDEAGIDEGADGGINNWFSIYSNRYPAGTFSILQQGLSGNNMYGVVVQAVGPTGPPPAPTGLAAVNGDTQVTLSWSLANSASGYNILRSSTSGSGYIQVGSVAGTTFTDTGLANGVDYFYVVMATNILGQSTNSLEVVGHPNPVVPGLTATGGTNQISINWTALGGAGGYSVLRANTTGGPFGAIATGLAGTSYIDNTVSGGSTYFYRVEASLGGAGVSGRSATVSATTAPNVPFNVTVASFGSFGLIVKWTNADPVLSRYIVERSSDGSNFSPVLNLAGTVRTVVDTNLTLATTYSYRVQATNAGGYSSYSSVVSLSTPPVAGFHVNFGVGASNSANAGLSSPIPQGYLNDIGELFGDRTNGFFYGWTNAAGTNILRDARYRQNAASPDIRYDTFNHMQKSPGGAVWEFELTNGLYSVRVVAGDVTAVDSTFQHNIEGILTPTYVPVAGAWWSDFTVSVAVQDGRLTIAPGPSASNSKIDFVDIFPEIPIPVVIGTHPQSQTVEAFRQVSVAPILTQGSVPSFQWYFNGNLLDGATNRVLSFRHIDVTNAGDYFVIITNYAGSVTSEVATLAVTPDTTPPLIASVGSLDGTTVGICFTEEIDTNSPIAQEFSNYQVDSGNIAVNSLIFRPDGKSVLLVLASPITGTVSVDVLDIPDYAQNSTVSSTNVTPMGFTAGDVGTPLLAGRNFTCDNRTIEIVGGGGDIWGASDQGYFATKTVTGDFDARVRVPSLTGSNAITKGVLVARESRNADSANVHVSINPPPPGRNQLEMGLRPAAAAGTVAVGSSFIPAGIPNGWMRLTRLGNVFTGYRSVNGVDWILLGQTNLAFAGALEVGLAVTAHDNTLLATGTFEGLTIDQAFPDLSVSMSAQTNVVLNANINYSITVANLGVGTAAGVVLTDILPAGVAYFSATPSQGSCTFGSGTVSCNLGPVPISGGATVAIVVTATNAGTITNTVLVSTASIEPNTGNNSAAAATAVSAFPNPTALTGASYSGGVFSGGFLSQAGFTYEVQYSHTVAPSIPCIDFNECPHPLPALVQEPWFTLTNIVGDGVLKTFTDPTPAPDRRFYRILVH